MSVVPLSECVLMAYRTDNIIPFHSLACYLLAFLCLFVSFFLPAGWQAPAVQATYNENRC